MTHQAGVRATEVIMSERNRNMTKLGEKLIEAMGEMVAHSSGEKDLRERYVGTCRLILAGLGSMVEQTPHRSALWQL
jgi:hypothetical protein